MVWLWIIDAVGLATVMTLAWWIARRPGKAGWTDVFWRFGLGAGGLVAALAPLPGSHGISGRQALVAVLIGTWSCRLGLAITLRTLTAAHEDRRYARFRSEWGARFSRRLLGLLLLQLLFGALFLLAVMAAARNPAPPRTLDSVGAAVALIAITGEAMADRTLRRFRADRANRGRVCEHGLWAWSRHPNYFFEWLFWLAFPLLAMVPGWPWGIASLAAPVVIIWLLLFVSGIPPLERAMLASRGAAYRSYQARVSAFFPWPPRKDRPR